MKQLTKASLIVLLATVLFSCAKKEEGQTGQTATVAKDSAGKAAASTPAATGSGKYGIKSGIFTSKSHAMGQEIVTTTYFDDYGKKEFTETKMEMEVMKGTTVKTNNITIVNGDGFRYTIDMEKKTGNKTKDYGGGGGAMGGMDFSKVSESMMKEYNIKKLPSETVSGKECDVISMDSKMMKGTVATWKGITMKMDAEMSKMKITMVVTNFEENASVPASRFEVPKDVTITAY